MTIFEKIKNKFLNNRFFAILTVITGLIIYIASVSDSALKLKSIFFDKKTDSLKVVLEPEADRIIDFYIIPDIDSISKTINLSETTDLNYLLKKIAYQKNDSICLEWSVLSDINSIHWLSNGIDEAYEIEEANLSCPSTRLGILALSNSGKPIYKQLEKKLVNGKWKLTLCGSNCGVYEIVISNIGVLDYFEGEYLPKILDKNVLIKNMNYINDTSMIYPITNRYLLTFQNKKSLYINESLSCGSFGCNLTFVINFEQDSPN
jgi:hypothetical protein